MAAATSVITEPTGIVRANPPLVYLSETGPEDLVPKYCKDTKPGSKASYGFEGPAGAVLANVAAPFYLYTQLKGKSDVWDRILKETPETLLQAPTLDVGCGRGLVLLKIAERKKAMKNGPGSPEKDITKAYGISAFGLGDEKVAKTAANIEALGVTSLVVLHDFGVNQSYPFADGSFGLVTASTVLHHTNSVPKRKAIIREMARVCQPGGRLIVLDLMGYIQALKTALIEDGWPEKDVVLSMAGPGVMYGMWPGQILVASKPHVD